MVIFAGKFGREISLFHFVVDSFVLLCILFSYGSDQMLVKQVHENVIRMINAMVNEAVSDGKVSVELLPGIIFYIGDEGRKLIPDGIKIREEICPDGNFYYSNAPKFAGVIRYDKEMLVHKIVDWFFSQHDQDRNLPLREQWID